MPPRDPYKYFRAEARELLAGLEHGVAALTGEADDAVGFRFGDERFVAGEYVSLTLTDGEQHTYVVAAVAPV